MSRSGDYVLDERKIYWSFPRPAVVVDLIIFTRPENAWTKLYVLLASQPGQEQSSFPTHRVDKGLNPETIAKTLLTQETGYDLDQMTHMDGLRYLKLVDVTTDEEDVIHISYLAELRGFPQPLLEHRKWENPFHGNLVTKNLDSVLYKATRVKEC